MVGLAVAVPVMPDRRASPSTCSHVRGVRLTRIDAPRNWLEPTGTTRGCRSAHSVPDEPCYQRIPRHGRGIQGSRRETSPRVLMLRKARNISCRGPSFA